jgi:hypothetical protein
MKDGGGTTAESGVRRERKTVGGRGGFRRRRSACGLDWLRNKGWRTMCCPAAAESVSGNGRDFRGRCRERGRAPVALSNAGGFSPACFSLAHLVGLAETENQA